MAWKRLIGLATVFGLGVATGGWVLRVTAAHPIDVTEAQQRALRVLDQPPRALSIGDNRIVDANKRIAPTVVNIDTVGRLHLDDDAGMALYDQEVRGKGSGVILTSDGYIVTNNHVIEGANRIRVTLPDNRWYYARLIGRDATTDLAVVRIEVSGLPTAELGDSDRLQVGEWSIAVGNPLGLGSTTTLGVISALNRHNLQIDEGRHLDGAIQTDAAINRGNSGGALANINGQLIGINTAILSSGPNGGSIGLGFAIPANTVRRVAHELIASGKARPSTRRQPWLGIAFQPVPPQITQAYRWPAYRGVLISRVLPESPASIAGLKEQDILLSIDGKDIGDERDVREAVLQHKIGDRAKIHILRRSAQRELDIPILVQERPGDLPPAP
jgi:serine protease Do